MLSVLPVLSAFANNGKQSIKQICCMIYCLTSLIFIFKQFSSTIDWTQPSPLDATACSGLSISSGNSIPERDAPCQPWSCHVMPKRCSILVQMEITSLQNHPFESNSWRSPSKSPLMVGLTSEYANHCACGHHQRVQAWGCISNATAYHRGDVPCVCNRSFTQPKYTRHNFLCLELPTKLLTITVCIPILVKLLFILCRRQSDLQLHSVSPRNRGRWPMLTAMSLALPKLMGTAFWFTWLAWALSKLQCQAWSPVVASSCAVHGDLLLFWKVAAPELL